MATATVGNTTMWSGGGVQFLSLPDINFTARIGPSHGLRRQTNSSGGWLDFGGSAGGGFETPLGWWGDYRITGGLEGFWSGLNDSNSTRCNGSPTVLCAAIDPTGAFTVTPSATGSKVPTLITSSDRNANYWGGQAEVKIGRAEPVKVKPEIYRNDYFIIGADVRGIDQDNSLNGSASGNQLFRYDETLNTTYYGGYIGFGGEYSFGLIPGIKNVGGLYDRLGLRTYVSAKAGLYDAATDYDGHFVSAPFGSSLSKSHDELAFIGTVSLETRKQLGPRTSLSLWTDYEYISAAPKMRYANGNGSPTEIDSEGLFASRTMLRLNIGLGPDGLYLAQ
jgi:hypothetical protein